jgi:hypothetical protein
MRVVNLPINATLRRFEEKHAHAGFIQWVTGGDQLVHFCISWSSCSSSTKSMPLTFQFFPARDLRLKVKIYPNLIPDQASSASSNKHGVM